MDAMPVDVARALGDLEGTVRSLKEQWAIQEKEATEGRRRLHDKFDALVVQVHNLTGVAYGVQEDVTEIKRDIDDKIMPTIDAYNIERARHFGAVNLGKIIWAGILAGCAAVGFTIHYLFLYFSGRAPGH
jgi:hypothetical protein